MDENNFRKDMKCLFDNANSDLQKSTLADFVIYSKDKEKTFCHKCVLAARSPFFHRLFSDCGDITGRYFDYDSNTFSNSISFPQFNPLSVNMALEYIYFGNSERKWDSNIIFTSTHKEIEGDGLISQEKIYHDFNELVKLLELNPAEIILYSTSSAHNRQYISQFLNILASEQYFDINFNLKTRDLYGHAAIISARSPFFAAILGPNRYKWKVNFDEMKLQMIDLKHLDSDSFLIVLHWIYGESDTSCLFKDLFALSLNDLLQNLITILTIAAELLLEPLKNICSYVLSTFIHLGNVWELLQTSIVFQAQNLMLSCLDFSKSI